LVQEAKDNTLEEQVSTPEEQVNTLEVKLSTPEELNILEDPVLSTQAVEEPNTQAPKGLGLNILVEVELNTLDQAPNTRQVNIQELPNIPVKFDLDMSTLTET